MPREHGGARRRSRMVDGVRRARWRASPKPGCRASPAALEPPSARPRGRPLLPVPERAGRGRPAVDAAARRMGRGDRRSMLDGGPELQPYFPTPRSRWIDVLGDGDRLGGRVESFPTIERDMLLAEGVVWTTAVPVCMRASGGGSSASTCAPSAPWNARDRGLRVRDLVDALGAGIVQRAARTSGCSDDLFRRSSRRVPPSPTSTRSTTPPPRSTSARRSRRCSGYSPQEWTSDPDMWRKVAASRRPRARPRRRTPGTTRRASPSASSTA